MHTVIIYNMHNDIIYIYIYLHSTQATYVHTLVVCILLLYELVVLVRARSMDVLRGVATACIRELPLVGLMMSACETTALSNVEVLDDHGSINNWGLVLPHKSDP